MNYLLDRKAKKKKIANLALLCVLLFILFYFRFGIWSGLSSTAHLVFRPVIIIGNNIGGRLASVGAFFSSKTTLSEENQNLKSELDQNQATMTNYNSLLAENISLKETLGRKNEKTSMTLSAVLSKPNISLYDTLVIDVGTKENIQTGDMVFALGNIPVGRISEVYPSSSKVTLFSSSGEKTQVVVGDKNVFMEALGRGGGNFEMIIPRDFTLVKGDHVVLPGIMPYVLGVVETTISDPRDPFIKALLVSPVNIQEIKFVEVEKR